MKTNIATKIFKYLTIFIFIGVPVSYVGYLFVQNPDSITLSYWPGKSISLRIAASILATFTIGVLFSGVIALLLSAKHSVEEWLFERKYKALIRNQKLILDARENLVFGRVDDAARVFNRVLDNDPRNLLALFHLVEVLKKKGELKSALLLLERFRENGEHSTELLVEISNLQNKLGNHSAAVDNLSLILKNDPTNKYALKMIVESFQELKLYDRALHFQNELVRVSGHSDRKDAQEKLADLELLIEQKLAGNNFPPQEKFKEILKRHKNHPATLVKLAEKQYYEKDFAEAGKNFLKAYQGTPEFRYLEQAVVSFLKANDPAKAIATAKSGFESKGREGTPTLVQPGFLLINLYLHLGMLDDAAVGISALEESCLREKLTSDCLILEVLKLRLQDKVGAGGKQSEKLIGELSEFLNIPGDQVLDSVVVPKKPTAQQTSSVNQ
jgi:tetratricopeptide (TPR) repeat protein